MLDSRQLDAAIRSVFEEARRESWEVERVKHLVEQVLQEALPCASVEVRLMRSVGLLTSYHGKATVRMQPAFVSMETVQPPDPPTVFVSENEGDADPDEVLRTFIRDDLEF